jgi:type VI protein secretion system component VasK
MAERIREAFFQSGGKTPEWRVSATPVLPMSTSRFTLAIDGRRLVDYRLPEGRLNGGITRSVVLPSSLNGRVSAAFSDDPDRSPVAASQGAWAWFRLLDITPATIEDGRRYVLTFQTATDRAQIRVQDAFPSEPPLRHPPPVAVERDGAVPDWKQLLRKFRCG